MVLLLAVLSKGYNDLRTTDRKALADLVSKAIQNRRRRRRTHLTHISQDLIRFPLLEDLEDSHDLSPDPH
jgi:hypothetical protein